MQLSSLLKSLTGDPDTDKEAAVAKLDGITDRARGLKRKLDDLQPSADKPSVLRDRLAYVETSLLSPTVETSALPEVVEEGSDGKEENGTGAGDGKRGSTSGGRQDEVMRDGDEADDDSPAPREEVIVEEVASRPGSSTPAESVEDRTLDRYVIDHLLRTGRMKTARALAAAQGIENLVDIKLFAELVRIESALLEKHSCAEALAWCGENRGTLKKQEVS